jgi:hypothetical protein
MLNGPLSNDLSRSFARRLREESGGELPLAVDRAFRLGLGRPPTPAATSRWPRR